MIAKRITEARKKNEPIIHKLELRKLTDVALEKVAKNYLQYKDHLKNLDMNNRIKVYETMSVDYPIEEIFPLIDHEPFWERACKAHFKANDCSMNGNSWKQCYAENFVKRMISYYDPEKDSIDDIIKYCRLVNYHIFNLDISTFSADFDISIIPQYFVNLMSLSLKYSPILREEKIVDVLKTKLTPIKDEYSRFGMRVPELKRFCVAMSDLSYFLSLSFQGNLIDDDMVKWLVSGLITNQTLRVLDLSHNRITEKGMIKIASFLMRTRSLFSLDLTNNLISGEGAYCLGLVLKENTRLKILKLAMNRFDDVNGGRILKMLSRNVYLEELNLSSNDLGVETVANLNITLKTNKMLKIIDLSNTSVAINNETKHILENINETITHLDLRYTKSLPDDVKHVESILIKRSAKNIYKK